MIFVTVGMRAEPFLRLVRAADEMALETAERVVIQYGSAQNTPRFAEHFDFADEAQMQMWVRDARVLVTHGGAGSILEALEVGKPLVIAPRLKCYGEAVDDHQLELAEALDRQGKAVIVTEPSSSILCDAVARAEGLARTRPTARRLQSALSTWLSAEAKQ